MLKVLNPGLQTTVQDLGRIGFRNFGVPKSGVMDAISAGFANAILNNNKNDAVLEMTLLGPKIEFLETTSIVVSGAEMSAKLNDTAISNYKIYKINKGDIMSFENLLKGTRAYLAVKEGFQTETVLKSKSFYEGITKTGILSKNDIIQFKPQVNEIVKNNSSINNKLQFYESLVIEISKGPEFELFSLAEIDKLLKHTYTVSVRNNRMGYRLDEVVNPHSISMITSPVLPGTVQLIPSGQLIILMKDAQTTGGYPRVFQLTEKAIAILAQKKAGDQFNFKLV
jgi:biotin-dependent carboxylase-like uncharacterized protein